MIKGPLVLLGFLCSSYSMAAVRELNEQETSYCKIMRKQGAAHGGQQLGLSQLTCDDLFYAGDEASRQLIEAVGSITTDDDSKLCYLAGMQDAIATLLDRAVEGCSDKLSLASLAGYALGYGYCFMSSELTEPIILEYATAAAGGVLFDPDKFLIMPAPGQAWTQLQELSTGNGFLVGCSIARQDVSNGQPSRQAREHLSTPAASGYAVGQRFAEAFCGTSIWSPQVLAPYLPETDFKEFAGGYELGWRPTCLNEGS
ncbi:MAG: hypothetical protein M3Q07_02670 [Pseudobdellovibrionaceae bacterium]|nr:hypothetical protein [Pseudobdellovibrionaceae bacterium]